MTKSRLIRLISSADHDISHAELVDIIKKTGTDRYDSGRKHIFHDFYGKHDFDFFAEKSSIETLEADINKAVNLLPSRTKGDRGYEVKPDIVIIYDGDKCIELDGVYDYKSGSDCFKCRVSPLDAFIEVREVGSNTR
jgi:hypothetical protein